VKKLLIILSIWAVSCRTLEPIQCREVFVTFVAKKQIDRYILGEWKDTEAYIYEDEHGTQFVLLKYQGTTTIINMPR
jgi:hypothetical protein